MEISKERIEEKTIMQMIRANTRDSIAIAISAYANEAGVIGSANIDDLAESIFDAIERGEVLNIKYDIF